MELTHHRIDVAAALAAVSPETTVQYPVQDVVERKQGEVWLIAYEPIDMVRPINWFHSKSGDAVMIPLMRYLTYSDPDLAMAFMFQLGVRCAGELKHQARRLHVATGNPVDQIFDEISGKTLLRYYLGFAILL